MNAGAGRPKNLAASVRQRLLNVARRTGEDYNALLVRFTTERLLFRISRSTHADDFLLKGAWLFYAWDLERRATRDVDFLGFGESSPDAVEALFRDILGTEVEPDGVTFDVDTLWVAQTRDGAAYPGERIRVEARLGAARITVQVDVGYGDAVVGEPEVVDLPPLLDFSAPRLRAYTVEAAVAEKVEAIVRFGIVTTRFKDFFDLTVLASERELDGLLLRDQIRETFARRGTEIPAGVPAGLGDAFAEDSDSQRQRLAFLGRSKGGGEVSERFPNVVTRVRGMVLPVLQAAAHDRRFAERWVPSVGWR
ncbi:MAG: nucleotidyl transferase AbiEii/AbiGii toxin family protein [Thioalkalivibrio sp.]|nr:nucleotidyl transferase AbiEii/AbiGii toxin family protein [Thioalkalivibrio sp.]